jgi:hypothetical protein
MMNSPDDVSTTMLDLLHEQANSNFPQGVQKQIIKTEEDVDMADVMEDTPSEGKWMATIHARSAIRRTTFNDGILFFAEDHGSISSPSGPPGLHELSKPVAEKSSKPKPASVGLNDEDTLIITLKQQGYKDTHISQELVRRGFRRLDHKTIATRTTRILGIMAKYVDDRLADGSKEWDEHEVGYLAQR